MKPTQQDQADRTAHSTKPMPVLFVGHGTPMNAIEDNDFSRGWREVGKVLPRPRAILCISAHWETWGALVTATDKPRTIHDFGGFPGALSEAQYPAPGSPWLAQETQRALQSTRVGLDADWGLDHGCWSVLMQMFPAADIPVVQLSLDQSKSAPEQYALAKELAPLRRKGVLIVGSGNMVHNLGRIVLRGNDLSDFNQPFGLDWAMEANELFKRLINENRHAELADYAALGSAVRLAVPTPEHYLPLLYALALKQEHETVLYFNDQPVGGSLTMTSLIIDDAAKNVQYAGNLEDASRAQRSTVRVR
jgi:4,5-DOPA dioxygenase extradiol